jgi:8-amino-7-oxononanoate synthase
MSLFDKFEQIAAARQPFAERGIRSNVVMEKVISSTEAIINGRSVILAGTNNYLGLTFDPDCIEAASMAVKEQGTGTTGSRMANGSYSDHVQLEIFRVPVRYGLFDRIYCEFGNVICINRARRRLIN